MRGNSLLKHITLTVVPAEYKEHKKQWYFDRVKEVIAYPPEIDCIMKKRKWLAHNSPSSHFYIIDDDVDFLLWDNKAQNHIPSKVHENKKILSSYMLESLPALLDDGHAVATFAGRFMAKPTLLEHGPVRHSTGYCAVMYRREDALKMKYNRMMFYNDADLLLQSLVMTGKKPVQDLRVIIQKRNTKKFDGTGADVYRNEVLVNDSLTRIVRHQRGRVYGMKPANDHSLQNRLSISYQNSYKWKGYSEARHLELRERSRVGAEEMMKILKLKAMPVLTEYKEDMQRAEIMDQIKKEWEQCLLS